MLDSRPSVQSRVSGSSTPYSSATVMALGLMVYRKVFLPSLVCERARVLRMTVLPPPVCPTTIVVWRVMTTSYSWMTLSTCSDASAMTLKPCAARSPSTSSLSVG